MNVRQLLGRIWHYLLAAATDEWQIYAKVLVTKLTDKLPIIVNVTSILQTLGEI